jgi:hypothetical protein
MPERVYVPLPPVATLVIDALELKHGTLTYHAELYRDPRQWGLLDKLITAVNGVDLEDVEGRAILAAWTHGLPRGHVLRVFIEVRKEFAARFQISLDGEPDPVFPPEFLGPGEESILREFRGPRVHAKVRDVLVKVNGFRRSSRVLKGLRWKQERSPCTSEKLHLKVQTVMA